MSSLNHTASRVCDNLARMPCAPRKAYWSDLPQFGLCREDQLPLYIKKQAFTWLLGRSLNRSITNGEAKEVHVPSTDIPIWSGYNSTMGSPTSMKPVGNPPLIATPAHEWQTLLTILMQAQNIKTMAVGQNRRTVISLDMGLYQPAKKLQITRPGELDIVMA